MEISRSEKLIRLLPLSESERIVLSYFMTNRSAVAPEIVDATKLSKMTVYKVLSSLVSKGYVIRTSDRPSKYMLSDIIFSELASSINEIRQIFRSTRQLAPPTETRKYLEDICNVFEKQGFAIRERPDLETLDEMFPSRWHLKRVMDKIADAEYSIGISIIDSGKMRSAPRVRDVDIFQYLLTRFIIDLNLLTIFVFIDRNFRGSILYYKRCSDALRELPLPLLHGITGTHVYVFRTGEDLSKQIVGAIQEIRQKRMVIASLETTMRKKVEDIQNSLVLSQGYIRRIDDVLLGRYRPFQTKRIQEGLERFSIPFNQIKNRERRNLEIFERELNEERVRIQRYFDAFDRRVFIPSSDQVEQDIFLMDTLLEKFEPIEFELSDLSSGMFDFAAGLVVESARSEINPFMFTEPYEPNGSYVNQEHMEKNADLLCSKIKRNMPNTFQIITGDAGSGKTHAIKYIYAPKLEKNDIKTLYIDCPRSYDILPGIFAEVTQESSYPNELVESIRELRKRVPLTGKEFITLVNQINDLLKDKGYKGMLIAIDEMENSIPYPYKVNTYEQEHPSHEYRPPLSFRQLKEIISNRTSENLGFIISCRTRVYPILTASLNVGNIEEFTIQPKKLDIESFNQLIEQRYATWTVRRKPQFSSDAIKRIYKLTNGNTRDMLRYSRELFKFAIRNKLRSISEKTIKKIGTIPVFQY